MLLYPHPTVGYQSPSADIAVRSWRIVQPLPLSVKDSASPRAEAFLAPRTTLVAPDDRLTYSFSGV